MKIHVMQRAVVEENDIGWMKLHTEGNSFWQLMPPLAGMVHGNSGFIAAYAALLKYTHDSKYQQIIDELLIYEDSLYSEQAGNCWIMTEYAKVRKITRKQEEIMQHIRKRIMEVMITEKFF